ncbi:MAG: hypothetical protein IJG64_00565 [Oscillospiraceae bacterium]|nr:hypothetical protein [Oscillospiraceae bacterium]
MLNETSEHRVKFPAFLLAAAITAVVAVVAVINLYVKCSPIAIGFTDAILDVDIRNNIEDDPVEYMLVKKSDYPIINDDNFTLIEKIIEKGIFESDDTGLYFKGLEPGTTYSVVFRTVKDGEDRLLKVYDFTTASPGEPGPGPVIPIGPVSSTDTGTSYPESSSDSERSSDESSSSSQSIGPSSSSSTSSSESSSSEQPSGPSATLSVYNTQENDYGVVESNNGEIMITGHLMGTLTINGTKLDESGERVEYPAGLDIDNIKLTITGSEQGTIVSDETVVGVWGTLERNSASIEIERIPFELGYPQEKITVTAVITYRDGQLTATGTYTMPAHGRDLTLSVTVFDNTAGGDIDYGTDDNGEIVWYPALGATYYLDGIKLNDAGDDIVYPSDIYTTEAGSIYATGRDGRVLADNTGVDMDIEDVVEGRVTLSADYLPLNIADGLYDNETIHFELGVGTNLGYITRTTDYTFRAPYTITHLVTFETEYGSPPRSQYVNHGEYARDPGAVDPAGADYTFDFWYDPSGTSARTAFDFANTPITDDITLRAHWTENNTDDLSLEISIDEHLDLFDYGTDDFGDEIVFLSLGTVLRVGGNALEVVNDQLVYPESIDELVHIKITDENGTDAIFEGDVEGSLDIENNVPIITIERLPLEAPVHPGDVLTIAATVTYPDGTLDAETEYTVPDDPAGKYSMTLELYYNTPSWVYPADGGDPQANMDLYGMLFLDGLEISGQTVTDPEGFNGEDVRISITRANGSILNSTAWGQPYVNDDGKLQITLISIPVGEPLDQNEPITVTATVSYDGGEITADAQFVVPEKTDPDPSQLSMSFAAVDDGEVPPISTLDGIYIAFPNVTGTLTISGAEVNGSTLVMPDSIDADNITVNFSDGETAFDRSMSGTLNVGSEVTITIDDLFDDGWPAGKTVTLTATVPYTYNGTTGSLTATTTYEVPDVPIQPDDLSLSLELSDDPSHMESYIDGNDQVMYIPAITPVIKLEGAVVENGAVTDPRSIADTVTFTFTRSTDSTTAPTVSFDASVRIEGQDVYIDVPQFTLPYQGLFGGETVTANVSLVCDGNEIVSNRDSYTAPQETDPDDVSLSVSVFERNPGGPVEYIDTDDARTYLPELNAVVVVEGATIDPTNSAITFPSALSGDTVDVLITVTGSNGRQIDILTMTGDVSVAGGNAQITVYNLPMGNGLFNNETITVTAMLTSDDFDNPGYREGSGTYLFTAPSDPTPVAPDFAVNSDSTVLFYGSGNFELYNGLIDSASVNLDVDALNNDGTVNSVTAVIQKFESGSPANTAATNDLEFAQTDTGYHISGLSFTNLQLTGVNDEIYVVITMNYTLDGEVLNKDVRIPVELSLLV